MSDLHAFFQLYPIISAVFVFAFGACIGSFLNVVVHRYPIMMYQEWQEQCHELNKDPFLKELPEDKVSLARPASACPSCATPIHPLHNIPVLSFLWLKARCPHCGASISPRYFLVELATASLAVYIFHIDGLTISSLFLCLFTFFLVPLIFIDIKHQLLPDDVTYLLLWTGVIFSLSGNHLPLNESIIGILAGYLSLWSVYILFKLTTGKEGMGHGDFKLLAAIGAWVGWKQILSVILISSIIGTIIGIFLIIKAKRNNSELSAIPFGPYLAFAGWVILVWGDEITHWYPATLL